jgi:ectoine hydroxylase-related dioxygenase (phytanoyl-CoA dioxygenase family)
MPVTDRRSDRDWLAACTKAVREERYCIVEGVLSAGEMGPVRDAMYRARERIVAEVGMAPRARRSTLWQCAGRNTSGKDRLAINHQFTRSYLKQQIDYVRALGEGVVSALAPRTQQLLGYYTRVVMSLDEYYRTGDERLYRAGQG